MAKLLLANPRKRKRRAPAKRRSSVAVSRRRKSPVKRRRLKRNPASRGTSVTASIKRSFIGATGAIAVDVATSQILKFAPQAVKDLAGNPQTSALVKGAIAIGIGYSVAKFGGKKKLGAELAEGGLTVALYQAGSAPIKEALGLDGMYGESGLLGYDDGLLGYTGVARQFDPTI